MFDLLSQGITNNLVEGICQKLGVNNKTAQMAIAAAIPLIIKGLQKNSSSQEGASSLLGALQNDHDGGILDNVMDFVGKGDFSEGSKILGHVLGDRREPAQSAIGKSVGLNPGQSAQIMEMLAPVVMGALGKQQTSRGINNESGVTDLLGSVLGGMQQTNQKEMSTLEKLLDQDGDGNAMDDVVDIGSKLLGGFFK